MFGKTASPTNVQTSFMYDKHNNADNQNQQYGDKSSNRFQNPSVDTDVSMSVTDDDKTDQKITTSTAPAPIEKTLDDKLTTTNKRSLFDLDNASSLSLADKLRNEANKYSEENQTNADKFSGTENYHQNDKKGETTSVMHPPHLNATAVNTTATTVVTERRPSWRLKLDAGSKVRTICFSRCCHIQSKKKSKKKIYKYVPASKRFQKIIICPFEPRIVTFVPSHPVFSV